MVTTPTLRLDSGSDTGLSGNDRITAMSRPGFSGVGDPGAQIRLFADGALVGQTTVDPSGKFLVLPTASLLDGTRSITATATLAGVVSSASTPLAVVIDTIRPINTSISLSQASDTALLGDLITADLTPTLGGKAESGAVVTILRDGTAIGQTTAVNGQWSFTPTVNQPEGFRKFSAVTTDVAGNTEAAAPVLSVLLDGTAPPPPTFNLAVTSDSGLLGDLVTNIIRPTLTGTGEDGSFLAILEGESIIGRATVSGGVWSTTLTADLSEGAHVIRVINGDAAGNRSETQQTIVIDTSTTAPIMTLAAQSDSGAAGDGLTRITTPFLTGTAEAGAVVTIRDGATQVATATAGADGSWTVQAPALAEGPHTLTAQARDIAGNLSSLSAPLAITIDATAPSAPTVSLAAASDSGLAGDLRTNDQTLSLTGTAEAGATVVINLGLAELGRVVATSTGSWQFDDPTVRPNGTVTYLVQQIDKAGNGSPVASFSPVIDLTAPSAPRVFLASASDTGSSSSDRITGDPAPRFTGITEANATILISIDGIARGSVAADGAGNWSFRSPDLSDGVHVLEARAVDAAGNNGAASQLSLTVDRTAPTAPTLRLDAASDTGRSAVDRITGDSTPSLSGQAEANSRVDILDGSLLLGTVLADAAGAFSFTPAAALADGSHLLSARASDVAGNSGPTTTLSITIDTRPETVSIDLVAASDTGRSPTDNITTDTTPTLDFGGTSGLTAGDVITVRMDGVQVGTITFNPAQPFTFTPATAVANGTHVFSATHTDLAGNVSAARTLNVTVDTVRPLAPTIALDPASDAGRSATDRLTNDTTPTFVGTAEAGATIVLSRAGVEIGRGLADASGNWNVTPSILAAGASTIAATAIDAAGNSGPAANLQVTIDDAAPLAPTIDLLTDSGRNTTDDRTNATSLTFSGTAEIGSDVSLFDGSTLLGTVRTNAQGAYSLTIATALAEGSHRIDAVATDAAGNKSPVASLPIVIDRTGPVAPAFSLGAGSDTGRFDNDRVTSLTSLLFTGTSEPGATIEIFSGATRLSLIDLATGLASTSVIAAADGSWSARNATAFTGSALSLSARATDATGNLGSSTTLAVTIDRTAPAAPVMRLDPTSDTGLSQTDRLTADPTPTVGGTAEANALVIVLKNGTEVARGVADASGAWSATLSTPLPAGVNTLTATATDLAGNVSAASAALTLQIDTQAPSAPTIRLDPGSDTGVSAADNTTADTTPTFNGTAEANARIEIREGNVLVATAQANASGVWTLTAPALSEGRHTLTARAIDAAGNVSAGSVLSLLVDRTAPVAPGIDLAAGSDSGRSNADNLTNARVALLQGVTEPNATLTIRSGTTILGTIVASSVDGSWTFPVNDPAEGVASFTVTATDLAGNTGPQSQALLVTVDRTAPALTAALAPASDSGRSASDRVTSDSTPTLVGQSEAGAEIFINLPGRPAGSPLPSVIADALGNWSFTPSTVLGQGINTIGITAVDAAGNSSAASTLAVEIDTAPPVTTVSLGSGSDTGVSATDRLTKAKTPTIVGVTDAGATVSVTIAGAGPSQVFTTTAGSDGTWSIVPAALLDGAVTVSARVEDAAGNIGPSATLSFTVDSAIGAPIVQLAAASDSKPTFIGGGNAAFDGLTSDNTPTFLIGNTTSGDTIVFLDNGVEIFRAIAGSPVALGQGVPAGSSVTLPPLADGSHSITVRLEDAAGNVSSPSATSRLLIDTIAPSAPSVPDLLAASDTGRFDDDNVTQTRAPSFSGTAEPGGLVEIFLDGVVVRQLAASSNSGAWSFQPLPIIADGVHLLTVRAVDFAGNTGPSASLSFTVDGTAPGAPTIDLAAFSDTGRSNTDNITSLQNLRLTGTASAGTSVEVLDGQNVITTAIALADGTWAATVQGQAAGLHAYTARAIDLAGNRSASSPGLAVTVDTSGPTTTFELDSASDTGISATDLLTSARTPTFRGKTDAGAVVTLVRNATNIGTVTADSTGAWSFTGSVPEGLANYSAVATDIAGNAGPRSALLAVNVDRTPPALIVDLLLSEDTGRSSSDNITSLTNPSVFITSEANVTLDVRFDTGATQSFFSATGLFSISKPLSEGLHSVFVRATDAAGNATAEQRLDITVDTTAPVAPTIDLATASDTGRSSTDNITRDSTPTFTGTAEVNALVELLIGGTVVGTATASSTGIWNATLRTIADGRATVTARAVDVAGNRSSTAQLTVTIDTVAPLPPFLSLDAMSDTGLGGDSLTADITPSFTINAGGAASDRVKVTAGPQGGVATVLADNIGPNQQLITLPAQPTGTTVVTVSNEDVAGNVATTTSTIRIDRTTPSGPTIDLSLLSDSGFSDADRVTKDNTPTFFGAARPGSTVTIKANGRTLGTTVANATSGWSFTPTAALADGFYRVEAFDGTVTTHFTTVEVDTAAPAAPVNLQLSSLVDAGFLGDFISTRTRPIFEIDIVPDAVRYQLIVNGTVTDFTPSFGESGRVSLTPTAPLSTLDVISVRAIDRAGNVSADSASRQLRIDTSLLTLDPASDTGTAGDGITSDGTPTFITTAAPGETIRFSSLQLGTLGSAVADASGIVRFTPTVALPETSLSIRVFTESGTPAAAGAMLPITIDRTGPAPVKILLSPQSDTGTQLDRRTADPLPTLKLVSASDVVSIEIRDGSTVIGTVNATGTSPFVNFTPSQPLSAGLHSLTAVGIDSAGNRGAVTSALSLTIDTATATAPTISSTTARALSPELPFDLYAPAGPIALSGSGRPGALIEILDGPTVIGSVSVNTRGDWSFLTSSQTSGSHRFTARDGAAQSSPLVVDVAPVPFIPFTMTLAEGADAGEKRDNRTSRTALMSGKPALEGTASPYAVMEGRVFNRQTSQMMGSFSVLADEDGRWSTELEILGLPATELLVTASATGALGNGQMQLALTLDATDDVVVRVDGTNTVFSGRAVSGDPIVVSVDGTQVGRVVTGTSGQWSLSVASSSLGEGSHVVRALTPAGQLISPLAQKTFTVDTIAPTAPTIALARDENSGTNGASVSAHATPTLVGTGEPGTQISVLKSDGSLVGGAKVDADGTWRMTVRTIMQPGIYSLTARASDGVNTTTSNILSLTVGSGRTNDPILGFSQAAGAEFGFTQSSTPELFGWIAEPFKVVMVRSSGSVIGTARSEANGEFFVRLLAPLPEGLHRLSVTGDTISSAEISLTVDRSPPAAPTISVSSFDDLASDGRVRHVLPTVFGLSEAFSTIRVYDLLTGTLHATTISGGSGSWSADFDVPLTGGNHQLVAIATDRAGNVGVPSAIKDIVVATVDFGADDDVRLQGANVFGHAGNDTMSSAGSVEDYMDGGSGDDVLVGSLGADRLFGGLGNDTASYAASAVGVSVSLATGLGTGGDAEGDRLSGIENIRGSLRNDLLIGDGRDNVLNGNGGDDRLEAGLGNDTYLVPGGGSVVINDAGGSRDTIKVGALANILASSRSGNDLVLTLVGGSSITVTGHFGQTGQIEFLADSSSTVVLATGTVGGNASGILSGTDQADVLDGRGGDDILFGMAGHDRLLGGTGEDRLSGGGGDDVLLGGTGADRMEGGVGNDIYEVDNAGDVVIEGTDAGYDRINSSISLQLAANVERLVLTGAGDLAGIGNALDNRIDGNSGRNTLWGDNGRDRLSGGGGDDMLYGGADDDTLDGGLGADVMVGGAGNDLYMVDDTGDAVMEQFDEGIDSVRSAISLTLGGNIENMALTGTAAIDGTGNALSNTITGNVGDNVLAGGGGNDRLYGDAGHDTLLGGADNDYLDGGAGADDLYGSTGNDIYMIDNAGDTVTELMNEGTDLVTASVGFTLGANLENLTLMGTADIDGTGNELANTIIGNAGANTLWGGLGSDRLSGGDGSDILIGGAGNDALTGGTGADHFVLALDGSLDTLTDFAPSLGDTIQFNRASFGIAAGAAVSDYVKLAAAAPDNAHGYILATNTGIFWDADGSGAGAAVKIATLQVTPTGVAQTSFTFD